MTKLIIDGIEVEVDEGLTVLQACEEAGAEIPRFCFHDRLSIAGTCAMPVGEGMIIRTNSPEVKTAREGVMEFLLINHPLDCPICDQGGECDLQDQAMAYGRHYSRYDEHKRAVKDKDVGPLIETIMTRCIHCTRCIRFADEIAGVEEFGAVHRGEHMEIGTYVEKAVTSELSGNMIDLCPVGALTSKPYSFSARSWELLKTESIDVSDAVGSNIRIDSRGREVMRILPRINENINEEWISDKTRFSYDGLSKNRLDRCYLRVDSNLIEASWTEAFSFIAKKLSTCNGDQVAAIAGDLADCESMFALKEIFTNFGSPNIDCRQDGAKLGGTRTSYIFNTSIAGIEEADALLIIGSDPRWEAPLVNARIRKKWLAGNIKIGLLGTRKELAYSYDYLGDSPKTLVDIETGKHEFSRILSDANYPMLILGPDAVCRNDGDAVLYLARKIAEKYSMVNEDWNGFNILNKAASRVGGLDLGFVPGPNGKNVNEILSGAEKGTIKFVWLLGADEVDMTHLADTFVVYQGHHGDSGAEIADVILPGAAFTEKNSTYVNIEGRIQRSQKACVPPGDARDDWTILRAFSDVLKKPLQYNNLGELRNRMSTEAPLFKEINIIPSSTWTEFGVNKELNSNPFSTVIDNFYLTDVISRSSPTMAKCSNEFVHNNTNIERISNG